MDIARHRPMIYRHQRDGAVFGLIPQPHIVLFHGNGIPPCRFFPDDRPDILKIDQNRLPSYSIPRMARALVCNCSSL